MEKIKLTRDEKQVFRLVMSDGDCPDSFPSDIFAYNVRLLEGKGLVRATYSEKDTVVAAKLTHNGVVYIAKNPKLRNPIDWKWIITTILTAATLVVSARMIIIACSVAR